jgi:hypothetical protein
MEMPKKKGMVLNLDGVIAAAMYWLLVCTAATRFFSFSP